jgi:hypothetical protein
MHHAGSIEPHSGGGRDGPSRRIFASASMRETTNAMRVPGIASRNPVARKRRR